MAEDLIQPTRRMLAIAPGAVALAAAAASAASAQAPLALPVPALAPAFTVRLKVSPIVDFPGLDGGRRFAPIAGGVVEGARLKGEVLANGADWVSVRANGDLDLVARYAIKASDGAVIGVTSNGFRRVPGNVAAQLAAGQIPDPKSFYYRLAPVFDVGPGPHHWLTENLFVGASARVAADEVRIDIYIVT